MVGLEGHIFTVLRHYFQHYGYWTIAFMLLLENIGAPVPGETTLLFASFLAYSEHQLRLPLIIVVGIAAAMIGDNSGYAIGYFGGRPLVDKYLHVLHISGQAVRKGENFFATHGASAIFWSRFVAGLRVLAGPLAGTLHMPWRRFFLFNFLGAATWVTMVATTGYFFGRHWQRLMRFTGQFNLAVLTAILIVAVFWCWKRYQARSIEGKAGSHMTS